MSATHACCQLPVAMLAQGAMLKVVQTLLDWLAAEPEPGQDVLAPVLQDLARHAISGSNSVRFIKAALEQGVPMERLPGGVIQYGIGSRRRRLESSFTDATPNIGARLARNKAFTNALFARAGLPVPRQVLAESADAAVAAANRLGYPVVVKPADLDGGSGVAAGLAHANDVRRAFLAARQLSAQILVEQHIPGRDYRLTVFQGEMIWAIERIPARVTGDGRHTIAQLVERENTNPLRGDGPRSALKRLKLDQEGLEALFKQGLTETSVARAGQVVPLRHAANVASGGEPVAVFAQVHPDNARLAVRAAEQLGLDLAGIDLLIPDVSRSWRAPDNAGAICEINGQPNLGQITSPHIYGQILAGLLQHKGRIPIIVVLGAREPAAWLQALSGSLAQRGLNVGTAGAEGVFLAGTPLTREPVPMFQASKMLTLDPGVDAIVVALSDSTWLTAGLPWARFDTLVLAGTSLPPISRAAHGLETPGPHQWIQSLLPACDGLVIAGAPGGGAAQCSTAEWHYIKQLNRETPEEIVAMTLARYGSRSKLPLN